MSHQRQKVNFGCERKEIKNLRSTLFLNPASTVHVLRLTKGDGHGEDREALKKGELHVKVS